MSDCVSFQIMQRNPILTSSLEIFLLSHSNIFHPLHTSLPSSSLHSRKSLYALCVFLIHTRGWSIVCWFEYSESCSWRVIVVKNICVLWYGVPQVEWVHEVFTPLHSPITAPAGYLKGVALNWVNLLFESSGFDCSVFPPLCELWVIMLIYQRWLLSTLIKNYIVH